MANQGEYGTAERDLYANLGVTQETPIDEIKKIYRKLAIKLHPDKLVGKELNETEYNKKIDEFRKIQRAWDVLGDEQTRLKYHADRRNFLENKI
jgi:DnaJ-class molecular chaperone